MSDDPSDKIHRRCIHCQAIVHTRARKSFRCPNCGKRTRVYHARAVKPVQTPIYYKKMLDQFREDDPR